MRSCATLLLIFCTALQHGAVSALELTDYFYSSPSFDGLLYGDGSSYTLHEVRLQVAVNDFQWVLLGFPRPCTISVDNSPDYDCNMRLQGHSSKYVAFPKKRYLVDFTTDDHAEHEINLRNSRLDPSFSREKIFHDLVSTMGTAAVKVSHARVYVNGEYNGLYLAVENIGAQFMYDNVEGNNVTLQYYNNNPDFETTAVETEVEYEHGLVVCEDDESSTRFWDDEDAKSSIYGGDYVNKNVDSIFYNFYSKIYPYQSSSSVFDFVSLLGVAGAKQFMQVFDFNSWNYFYAVGLRDGTTNQTKLQVVAWDADKLLGITRRGKVIKDNLLPESNFGFKSFDRQFYFSETDVVGASPSYDGPAEYVGLTEWEAYTTHWLNALEDDALLSVSAITSAAEILRDTLRKEAERDLDKWSHWFAGDRLDFDPAVDEFTQVMTVRHDQYMYELNSSASGGYPHADARYSNNYYDDEYGWAYVRPNPSMVAFLSVILALNVLSFLFPDMNGGGLTTKLGWLRALTQNTDDASLEKMSSGEVLQSYGQTCVARLLEVGYMFNVTIGVVLLVGYIYYVKYDFTDDSEILGHHYMYSVKWVWLYFATSLNVVFLIRNHHVRVIVWILVVLATNVYGIYDLFEFSQVTGGSESTNSRGVAVSLDSDNSDTFYLYVSLRLMCQAIVMRYSLEIPSESRMLAEKIEKEDGNNTTETQITNVYNDALFDNLGKGDLEMVASGPAASTLAGGDDNEDTAVDDEAKEKAAPSANAENKRKMKMFMHLNMATFILICVGFVIYIFASGLSKSLNFRELFFSVLISVAILVNIRAFYSCVKYFWLHAYGFDAETLDVIFGNREDESKWSLDRLKQTKLTMRKSAFDFLLPGVELSTEKKMRTVDGWTKKVAHTYDGLLVFILSAQSFSSNENATETYSLAYMISMLYMILYVVTYRQNGTLGWIIYGAKSRIMDGYLGRENEIFGYMFDKYMLPVSAPLLLWLQNIAGNSRTLYLSWYIFMPIIVGDSCAEIVGATWGKQKIKVWGMGEVNKKSWEGTAAMFLSSFLILLPVNIYFNLAWTWYVFGFFICLISTFVELFAYRSTDNVCMLIISALLSVAFISMVDS